MAGRASSISRRRVLGAAVALPILASIPAPAATLAAPPDRRLWNRRLARYRRLAAQAEEVATTGWFAAANARHASEVEALKARFGSWDEARTSPEGAALCDAMWRRMDEAEDAYWNRCTEPMQKAAVALARTPAPDLGAFRTKLAIVRERALEDLDPMAGRLLETVLDDLEKMTGGPDAQVTVT